MGREGRVGEGRDLGRRADSIASLFRGMMRETGRACAVQGRGRKGV